MSDGTTDEWAERINALSAFGKAWGFGAIAFFTLVLCGMWGLNHQLANQSESLAISRLQAESNVKVVQQVCTDMESRRSEMLQVLDFTRIVPTEHTTQNAAHDRQDAAHEAMSEALRQLIDILTAEEASANEVVAVDPIGT